MPPKKHRPTDPMLAGLVLRGAASHDIYQHSALSSTETVRTVLEGQLAQRVRRRLELPPSQKVWLKERFWEGGTDCTRECAVEFVVGGGTGADATGQVFYPDDASEDRWTPRARDSVYARFDHWLSAAHTDARCWTSWTDEAAREQNGNYAKIPVPLTGALGAAAARGREPLSSAYFWGARRTEGWSWELHTIALRGFPRPEHGDVFHPRVDTHRFDLRTRTAAETLTDRRRLLMHATDRVMPGRAPLL
ncbi:hypothetical protein ACXR2T_07845 [Leucobacter sp. HY1910]